MTNTESCGGGVSEWACVVGVDTTYRFWRKADWVTDDTRVVFRLNEQTGHVTVRQPGVYLIYAQVGLRASGKLRPYR